MSLRRWTAEEDALLSQHADAELVRRTNRSLSAVQQRRQKLGIPTKSDSRRRDDRLPEIEALMRAGSTRREIAELLGMSASSLSHYLRVRGVAPQKGNRPMTAKRKKQTTEETRVVPWLPQYSVGRDGTIWSERTDPPTAIVCKQHRDRPRVRVTIAGQLRDMYVAVLVAAAWHGERPPGHVVGYHDDDPMNIACDNLYWRPETIRVSAEEFVRAYMASSSISEAAERLGMTPNSVSTRSSEMRKRGVPLPRFSRRGDWDPIIKLAKSLAGGDVS